jgi:hypothetical protein
MKILGYLCIALGIVFLLGTALAAWFFRDGLGPDSVTSSGFLAWGRFWRDFRFALAFAAPVLAVGAWCIRHKREALKNEQRST